MLSEKAKGKQRARDPPGLGSDSGSDPMMSLVIRFTEGVPDLTLDIRSGKSLKDVKKDVRICNHLLSSSGAYLPMKIRERRPQLKDRRLRLIHSGRLLTDSASVFSLLESLEERQKQSSPAGDGPVHHDVPLHTTWLHCSIGPPIAAGEDDDTKVQVSITHFPLLWLPAFVGTAGMIHRTNFQRWFC